MKYPVPELTGVDIAFPSDVERFMPLYEEIPKEFKGWNSHKYSKMISQWFFSGIKIKAMYPRDGVDAEKAFNAIRAIIGSYQPKHEHKIAGAAFLCDHWFEKIEWENSKG